jgi:hypothetical protein
MDRELLDVDLKIRISRGLAAPALAQQKPNPLTIPAEDAAETRGLRVDGSFGLFNRGSLQVSKIQHQHPDSCNLPGMEVQKILPGTRRLQTGCTPITFVDARWQILDGRTSDEPSALLGRLAPEARNLTPDT